MRPRGNGEQPPCHGPATKAPHKSPLNLEKARPQPSTDYLIKIPCPFHPNGFPGRQPSRHSQWYCQMLLWESENLRFNLVSSRPCQVSPAETGPKRPTVYLAVTRFGSHGSPPQDGTAQRGVHGSRAPMPTGALSKTRSSCQRVHTRPPATPALAASPTAPAPALPSTLSSAESQLP